MSNSYDVVVVGAGAIGLSSSYLLSKRGIQTAVVAPLGDNQIATAAAGAMIDAFGEIEKLDSPRKLIKLDYEIKAQRCYSQWLEEIEEDSGQSIFSQEGIVVIANTGGEHDIPKMKLMREKMIEYDEPFEEMDVSDIVGLCPNYLYRAHEAFLSKSGRSVDTQQLLSALRRACEKSNKVTMIDARVVSILENKNNSWIVNLGNERKLVTSRVVVCAGAYSLGLIKNKKLTLPKMYFGRGSSITVVDGPVLPYTLRTPNRALSCGIHMVPQAHKRLYLGATNLFGVNYGRLPKGPTCGEIHTLLEAIQNELNTSLRNISIQSLHSGLRPVTQFDEPLCGETNLKGLYIATGTHRTGVHMSPLMAETIANSITGDGRGEENPFDPRRKHDTSEAIDLKMGVRALNCYDSFSHRTIAVQQDGRN